MQNMLCKLHDEIVFMSESRTTRPFLKWAGNKYRLMHRILPLLPEGGRLIEPFAGSQAFRMAHNY